MNWLKANATLGQKLNVEKQLYINGKNVSLTPSMSIVNGSPQLVKNGKISIDAKQEGFDYSTEFYYGFGLTRQPRTLAGIKANGDLIFVTVDGRSPENSIGVSFHESAELLKALGAVSAINLDGGGSSTMVINGKLVNQPSDSTGERPIGDGIFITK
jgi:exopolysaccharide biosynthesis protein